MTQTSSPDLADSQGRISVTPGDSGKQIASVRVLGKNAPIKYQWENGTLVLDYPEPDRTTPHDVIAATLKSTGNPATSDGQSIRPAGQ